MADRLTSVQTGRFAAFAEELAAAAARAILPFFRTPMAVRDKGADGIFDPVTDADSAAEEAMRALIAARFPDHGICGEEFPERNVGAEFTWILDPIDGTKSFILGFPLWGTMIGLGHGGRPVLGLVHQPFTGETFSGHDGGARYAGPGGTWPLKTRACAGLDSAMLTTTSPLLIEAAADRARFAALETRVRLSRYGGDCMGYCLLADGHIDLVAETGLKMHDIAPLIPIIEGAGGVVTDWEGGEAGAGGHVLAAGDRRLHAAALEILSD